MDGRVHLSVTVKERVRDVLLALSLSNLFFVRAWYATFYGGSFGYFNKERVGAATLLALATNIGWFTILSWLVMRAWRRWPNRWLRLIIHVLFFLVLLVPLDFCRFLFLQYPWWQIFILYKKSAVVWSTVVLVAVVVWQHRRLARFFAGLVGVLSPLALFILARTALVLAGLDHIDQPGAPPPLPAPGPVRANQPRVVWVIFDETDERLAFEQRPAGVQLPEFDRFRAQCLAATNAYPPGDRTLLSIPALISGERLLSAQVKDASELSVVRAEDNKTNGWTQLGSVFASARELGVNTALVGWHHPYARILGKDLNYCEWFASPEFEPTRGANFGGTLLREFLCPSGPPLLRRIYISVCRGCLARSLDVVTNDTYGLVFLHLPPPHRPGVYNPETGKFTLSILRDTSEYFNNLALADRFLGSLRQAMERTGDWGRTWVILSADHSWRWSAHYDGRRDQRVPFLVKPAGKTSPITYAPRMNTILSHDLILAILKKEIRDEAALVSWLDQHRSEAPTISDRPLPLSQ